MAYFLPSRCPMECSLISSAEEWSCQISLRFDWDKDGRALSQSSRMPFSPVLKEKSEVEIWIRRAQAAILSPHHAPAMFYTRNAEEIRDLAKTDPNMLKFSRNVVCVNIMDPGATDLSFVDLPGKCLRDFAGRI
jgi:vacuolar protein sorting-associated protein 1